ncbi:lipase member H [Drosophila serrata]|uniref:lipase member H n=1 Tax=Drosophila serrata TaxID=7274 RepID=UPI000A1CFE19|nr:lipase member H [Drosophila serrata]
MGSLAGMHILRGWISLMLLLGTGEMLVSGQYFAYAPGKCELTKSNVIESMFTTELSIILHTQPKLLHYDLYTPLNPEERQLLRPGDLGMLKNSHFNPKWPVRILIHGWAGTSTTCSNAVIKDAYLSRGNYNVIILDWSRQAMDINYARVSKQLASIAGNVAKLLRFLHDNTGVPYEQIYLVGHSAGSHISGLTGKMMKPYRLGAIFALDPAGLTQLSLGPEDRLTNDDALYVESIHTDLTLLGNPSTKLSQASFFVNWGLGQPHCPNATATEFDFVCDHYAAVFYFAESVRRPKSFAAVRCSSVQALRSATCRCNTGGGTQICTGDGFMGGEPAVPKRGIFYLSTRQRSPYGTGDGLVYIRRPIPSTIGETAKRRRRLG